MASTVYGQLCFSDPLEQTVCWSMETLATKVIPQNTFSLTSRQSETQHVSNPRFRVNVNLVSALQWQ